MPTFHLRTPDDVKRDLGKRVRALRLRRRWRQVTLAERSGVSLGSLRRFETSGRISLDNLLKLGLALDRLDDFEPLLRPAPARSIDELEAGSKTVEARRGRL